jgi:hypothetical protein
MDAINIVWKILMYSVEVKKNVREHRRGNQKWKIQSNWQQDEENKNKNKTQYVLNIKGNSRIAVSQKPTNNCFTETHE